MGRVQLFEVRLNHGRVVYSPGEPLVGAVRLRLAAPLPFRGRVEPCASAPRLGGSTSGSGRGRQCPPEGSWLRTGLPRALLGDPGSHQCPLEGSRLRTGLPRASLGDPGSHQSCLNAYAGAREGPTPAPAWDSHGPRLAAIRVTCTGSCRVSNKANDSAWVVEESYFNSALSLADKGSLPAGEHSFPFQFLLPATAPTSFEGPFGKIVHQVRATVDTPRFSKDHQCSRVFYILSPLNLNSIPDIEQPNVASTTKKFSYKLVKTGSVVLTASTDLRGYVVGQVLRLQADIENQSGKDTSPVVASLLQKVSYKAKRWIYDVRTIAEVEGAGVKAWRRAQWQEQVLVPALPQSALPGCSLIHVDYYLQVSLKQPEAVVTLPVFIGNIAVNHVPLSPQPGPGLVVPSAPPQEEAEAVASGPHFSDPVSLSTKSHSQQQQPHAALGSVPHGAPEPRPQDGSPAPHPLPPPLCISTGATVPYFAEGSGGPVPTSSTLILPPEYSSWGYPYEAPPSYEQSCGGVDPGLTPGS